MVLRYRTHIQHVPSWVQVSFCMCVCVCVVCCVSVWQTWGCLKFLAVIKHRLCCRKNGLCKLNKQKPDIVNLFVTYSKEEAWNCSLPSMQHSDLLQKDNIHWSPTSHQIIKHAREIKVNETGREIVDSLTTCFPPLRLYLKQHRQAKNSFPQIWWPRSRVMDSVTGCWSWWCLWSGCHELHRPRPCCL